MPARIVRRLPWSLPTVMTDTNVDLLDDEERLTVARWLR